MYLLYLFRLEQKKISFNKTHTFGILKFNLFFLCEISDKIRKKDKTRWVFLLFQSIFIVLPSITYIIATLSNTEAYTSLEIGFIFWTAQTHWLSSQFTSWYNEATTYLFVLFCLFFRLYMNKVWRFVVNL